MNKVDMKKLIKGEWYEFEGCDDCILQYNDGEHTKGWWNGAFGDNYHFKGMSDIAKPASERMLKKYGIIKEMKEKKKLNLNWIYLVASVIQLIAFASYLINGDVVIANTHLILSILFFNWYRDSVREANISALTVGKDLELTIERNKNRNN